MNEIWWFNILLSTSPTAYFSSENESRSLWYLPIPFCDTWVQRTWKRRTLHLKLGNWNQGFLSFFFLRCLFNSLLLAGHHHTHTHTHTSPHGGRRVGEETRGITHTRRRPGSTEYLRLLGWPPLFPRRVTLNQSNGILKLHHAKQPHAGKWYSDTWMGINYFN